MKNHFLKVLAVLFVITGLSLFGTAMPASAAGTMTSPSATSTGTIGTSGTNAYPITVTAISVSPANSQPGQVNSQVIVNLPTGWSFVSPYQGPPPCPQGPSITGMTTVFACQTYNGAVSPRASFIQGSGGLESPIPQNTTLSVTFAAGTLNVAADRFFTIKTATSGGTVVDSATATLGAAANYTVTFDANGGSGTTAEQTASSATALTTNGFSRTGYTFAGWNTVADGTGTAYADGASYPFTSNVTLYAQWAIDPSANLANTGFDNSPYFLGTALLAALGIMLFATSRRRGAR